MFHLFHMFHLFRPYFTRVSGERCSYSVAQDEKAEHMEHMEHMFLYIKIFFVCQDSGVIFECSMYCGCTIVFSSVSENEKIKAR